MRNIRLDRVGAGSEKRTQEASIIVEIVFLTLFLKKYEVWHGKRWEAIAPVLTRKKKAEPTENQLLFLDLSKIWGHRKNATTKIGHKSE